MDKGRGVKSFCRSTTSCTACGDNRDLVLMTKAPSLMIKEGQLGIGRIQPTK